MIIRAHKSDTGLSQSYMLETHQGPRGIICVVYNEDAKRVGQFTNPRQEIGDNSPLIDVLVLDLEAMEEVLNHWGRPQ